MNIKAFLIENNLMSYSCTDRSHTHKRQSLAGRAAYAAAAAAEQSDKEK